MKNLRKMINDELKDYRLVESEFIYDYIEYLLDSYKLTSYCQAISFDTIKSNNSPSKYDFKNKKIVIDDDKMFSCILENSYLFDKADNDYTIEDLKYIFARYLQIITHEIIHVKQAKIINTYSPSILREILKDDYKICKKYYEFYIENHNEFLSEINAEKESSLFIGDLFSGDNIFNDRLMLDKLNSYLAKVLLYGYNEFNGKITYFPARFFYENFKERDKGIILDNRENDDEYTRIIEGLRISYDLFTKLNKVKNGSSTSNIKKLVLNSNGLKK